MRIDIISAVPEQLTSPLETSIIKRARDKGLVTVKVHNLRDHAVNKHGQIDDYQFGGGPGMVLMVEPIAKAIRGLQGERKYDEIIFLAADGIRFEQRTANRLSLKENIILLAGHYKGIDQRARDLFATMELSIGDFVLSGGELPALILTDAIVRLIPGVLGDEVSALSDSFQDNLLEPPIYTRPSEFEGNMVPPVLLSGNFKEIEKWREAEALKKTRERRPDLLSEDEKDD